VFFQFEESDMKNIDWSKAPDWACSVVKFSGNDGNYWANEHSFSATDAPSKIYAFNQSDTFKTIEHRPDAWQEGEERMNNIGPNGNDGGHYVEVGDSIMSVDGYECLKDVLVRAYNQASKGKGDERHAQGSSFDQQPMQKLLELYGVGFALGQSAKKAQESMRLPKDRAITELLGGINYLAGAIIHMEKNK
tara:strand:- start:335 stop:907 length:573 start_codon:yes stop_codon:yes gene_type:complete